MQTANFGGLQLKPTPDIPVARIRTGISTVLLVHQSSTTSVVFLCSKVVPVKCWQAGVISRGNYMGDESLVMLLCFTEFPEIQRANV